MKLYIRFSKILHANTNTMQHYNSKQEKCILAKYNKKCYAIKITLWLKEKNIPSPNGLNII